MPNWCNVNLEVTGKKKDVREFWEKNHGKPANWPLQQYNFNIYEDGKFVREITEEEKIAKINQHQEEYEKLEPRFCFNALYPVPGEILEIGFDGQDYYRSKGIDPFSGGTGMFGHRIDGYHWCSNNWGTKWDIYYNNDSFYACDIDYLTDDSIDEDEEVTIDVHFDTAWAPPSGWLAHIAPMFPNVYIIMRYFESGVGFAGYDIVENGEYESYNVVDGPDYVTFVREYFDDEYGLWEDGDRICKSCNSVYDSEWSDTCPYCSSDKYEEIISQ